MAGIAIPIIIHLWDVQGGKRLKVGSILLIEESARLQGRSLRLTDILLLILRCLVIILLSIVLSKPIFKKQLTVGEEKGWLMIQRQDLQEAYNHYRPVIDSLTKLGYQFHYFDKDFSKDDLANALESADSLHRESQINHWTLLKRLNEVVPADLPIHVFAENSLQRFGGRRPELSMSLTWHSYTVADTVKKSLAMANHVRDDSIRILTANISNKSLFYDRETIARGGNNKYGVTNKITSNATGRVEVVDIDTSHLQIVIFADQQLADANYLKAAIEAIRSYTSHNITVDIVKNAADIKPKADWLFWLSEKALPTHATARRTFVYAQGKVQALDSWVRASTSAKIGEEPIVLSRRIEFDNEDDHVYAKWSDGFGDPLLVRDTRNPSLHYFYSRFNPAWTELPWSAQFAEMIFDLIMPSVDINDDFDKRMIADDQARPVLAKHQPMFDKEKFIEKTDLSKYFWLSAFLIFALERYLSLKPKSAHA